MQRHFVVFLGFCVHACGSWAILLEFEHLNRFGWRQCRKLEISWSLLLTSCLFSLWASPKRRIWCLSIHLYRYSQSSIFSVRELRSACELQELPWLLCSIQSSLNQQQTVGKVYFKSVSFLWMQMAGQGLYKHPSGMELAQALSFYEAPGYTHLL